MPTKKPHVRIMLMIAVAESTNDRYDAYAAVRAIIDSPPPEESP